MDDFIKPEAPSSKSGSNHLQSQLGASPDYFLDAIRAASTPDEARTIVREFLERVSSTHNKTLQDSGNLGTSLRRVIDSLLLQIPQTVHGYLAQQCLEHQRQTAQISQGDQGWDIEIASELQNIRDDARDEIATLYSDTLRTATALQPNAKSSLYSALKTPTAKSLDNASYLRTGHYIIPDNLAHFFLRLPSLPDLVPLLNHGHIVVESSGYTEELEAYMRQLVLDALWNTGPGELSVETFNPKLRPLMGPFAQLRKGIALFPGTATTTDEFERLTEHLLREVRRVSDLFRGRNMTLGDLKRENSDVSQLYRLVTVLDFPHGIDDRASRRLQLLLESGPSYGISFLIHHNRSLPANANVDTSAMLSLATTIELSGSKIQGARTSDLEYCLDPSPSVDEIITAVERIVVALGESAAPSLNFSTLHEEDLWTHNSADGVTATIGRIGGDPLNLTLGSELDQLHNVLVSGAVGQGKSVLLMALIHSIAVRYSPDEVQMYLIDLKEGLTLKPLAYDSDNTDSYLPHARVIALESDNAFATAVLQHLVFEFEERADLMRDYGENILHYRRANPAHRMPRVLVVIDEFQKLFTSDDYWSANALSSLVQLAREGRAYGIHLILASQTLSGIGGMLSQQDGIFAQFPVRLALKNSESESRVVLAPDNRDAATLRFRGEIVVNENFGSLEGNRRGIVADASNRRALASLRGRMCARSAASEEMRVFDGSVPASTIDYRNELLDLVPRKTGHIQERYAVVGASLSVEKALAGVRLSSSSGGHLAILGHGRSRSRRPGIRPLHRRGNDQGDLALGAILAALTGLVVQHPRGDADFVILDLLNPAESEETCLTEVLTTISRHGFGVAHHRGKDVARFFASFVHTLEARTSEDRALYVIGLGLDRIRLTDEIIPTMPSSEDEFNGGHEIRSSPLEGIRELLKCDASANARLLAWWALKASFDDDVGFDGRDRVTGFLALGLERTEVYDLIGRQIDWQFKSNRGLLHEVGFSESEIVVPFGVPSPKDIDHLIELSKKT